jgi:hypothetical protein
MEKRMPRKFDVSALLHPGRAFNHPADVVNDADLTVSEKRKLLSSWPSDARMADAPPHSGVSLDDIMDALRALQRQADIAYRPQPHYRRVLQRRRPGVFGRKPGDRGQPLSD